MNAPEQKPIDTDSPIERTQVKSSQIASIGHHENGTLEVEFKNGGTYRYADVSPETHAAVMASPSLGSGLHQHVKGKHRYVKLAPKS